MVTKFTTDAEAKLIARLHEAVQSLPERGLKLVCRSWGLSVDDTNPYHRISPKNRCCPLAAAVLDYEFPSRDDLADGEEYPCEPEIALALGAPTTWVHGFERGFDDSPIGSTPDFLEMGYLAWGYLWGKLFRETYQPEDGEVLDV